MHHAGGVGRIVPSVKISVPHADEEKEDSKDEPGYDEGGGKQSELVAPLHVHHRRPDVVQVELDHSFHVVDLNIVVTVFGHDPSLDL